MVAAVDVCMELVVEVEPVEVEKVLAAKDINLEEVEEILAEMVVYGEVVEEALDHLVEMVELMEAEADVVEMITLAHRMELVVLMAVMAEIEHQCQKTGQIQ